MEDKLLVKYVFLVNIKLNGKQINNIDEKGIHLWIENKSILEDEDDKKDTYVLFENNEENVFIPFIVYSGEIMAHRNHKHATNWINAPQSTIREGNTTHDGLPSIFSRKGQVFIANILCIVPSWLDSCAKDTSFLVDIKEPVPRIGGAPSITSYSLMKDIGGEAAPSTNRSNQYDTCFFSAITIYLLSSLTVVVSVSIVSEGMDIFHRPKWIIPFLISNNWFTMRSIFFWLFMFWYIFFSNYLYHFCNSNFNSNRNINFIKQWYTRLLY